MHREHQAWLAAMRELERLGIDINEAEQFHAAITLWGEELAHLRMTQERDVLQKAYDEATARYNREIGFLPMGLIAEAGDH
jgi:hypothetical protein